MNLAYVVPGPSDIFVVFMWLTDKEDPRWTKSSTERDDPNRIPAKIDNVEPSLQKLRKDSVLPSVANSITDMEEPIRDKPNTEN